MSDVKRTLATLELVGGNPCLDFVNTVNSRAEPGHEYFATYTDVIDWAGRMKLLTPAQVRSLKQQAAAETAEAARVLEKIREAREGLYRVFSATAGGSDPKEADLTTIAWLYQEAVANGRLVRTGGQFAFHWRPEKTLTGILWLIIAEAHSLLSSQALSQVKECPSCGWLFLDTSKNQSRRWCSMNTCGARDKMRRYHGKLKKK